VLSEEVKMADNVIKLPLADSKVPVVVRRVIAEVARIRGESPEEVSAVIYRMVELMQSGLTSDDPVVRELSEAFFRKLEEKSGTE